MTMMDRMRKLAGIQVEGVKESAKRLGEVFKRPSPKTEEVGQYIAYNYGDDVIWYAPDVDDDSGSFIFDPGAQGESGDMEFVVKGRVYERADAGDTNDVTKTSESWLKKVMGKDYTPDALKELRMALLGLSKFVRSNNESKDEAASSPSPRSYLQEGGEETFVIHYNGKEAISALNDFVRMTTNDFKGEWADLKEVPKIVSPAGDTLTITATRAIVRRIIAILHKGSRTPTHATQEVTIADI